MLGIISTQIIFIYLLVSGPMDANAKYTPLFGYPYDHSTNVPLVLGGEDIVMNEICKVPALKKFIL